MLEQIRKNSRSLITSILFTILIAAFVISINHTPARCNADLEPDSVYAAEVLGTEVHQTEFLFAYETSPGKRLAAYFPGQESRFKGQTMDALIERELLAHAAEDMGLRVPESEAVEMIGQGKAFIMGHPFPLKPDPNEKSQRGFGFVDGKLNYDQLEQILRYFGLTVRQFLDIQQRELLADKLRQLMKLSAKVSPEEIKTAFAEKNTKVKLEYVRFSPFDLAQKLSLTTSELETYAKTHDADLKKAYEARKTSYQKQGPQIHLHRLLINLDKDPKEEQKQEAKHSLEEAVVKIKQGSVFGEVASTMPNNSQNKGGDMGWLRKDATGLGKDLEAKVFAAKPGDVLGPEQTDRGLEVIQVDGFREGDISFDAAKIELAEEQYRTEKSKEIAKQMTQNTVTQLQAGKKLADLYPKTSEKTPAMASSVGIQVEETELLDQQGEEVRGIGNSKELSKAAFSKKPGETIGPLELNGASVIAVVKERQEPDWKKFDEQKISLANELQEEKANQAKDRWVSDRCKETKQSGKIHINMSLFQQENVPQAGQNPEFQNMLSKNMKYEPCQPSKGFLPF